METPDEAAKNRSEAAKKAWATRRARAAGKKAAATRKANESAAKRSRAAKKAWETTRARADSGAPTEAIELLPSIQMTFTPRSKKVMVRAVAVALEWGHDYVGTEHLLLGLLKEEDGIAGQVLKRLGVAEAAAEEVRKIMASKEYRGGANRQ